LNNLEGVKEEEQASFKNPNQFGGKPFCIVLMGAFIERKTARFIYGVN
jgi:hypothetical protein